MTARDSAANAAERNGDEMAPGRPGRLRISERTLEDLAEHRAAFNGTVDFRNPDQLRAWVAIIRAFDALLEAARAGICAEAAQHSKPRSYFGSAAE